MRTVSPPAPLARGTTRRGNGRHGRHGRHGRLGAGPVDPTWRHFKPNEHLWHITPAEFTAWIQDHGYEVLRSGSPEDAIRTRWDPEQMNIASFVVKRRDC